MIVAAAVILLQLHGLSYHFTRNGQNEANYGAAVRYETSSDFAIQSGMYRNSFKRDSYYIAADYTPLVLGGIRIGAFAGLVTGYHAPVAAGLSIRQDFSWGNAILNAVPATEKTGGFVALQVGVKF
jgi:hypothetical protein